MNRGITTEKIQALFRERFRGGFNELVGLEVVAAGEGFSKLRLTLRPELLQPAGIIHGGVVATMADVAAGVAAHLSHPPGCRCVTVEMKLNFLAAVSEGVIFAEADSLHVGRRTSVWKVRVRRESGKDIAFATATYMVVKGGPEA